MNKNLSNLMILYQKIFKNQLLKGFVQVSSKNMNIKFFSVV